MFMLYIPTNKKEQPLFITGPVIRIFSFPTSCTKETDCRKLQWKPSLLACKRTRHPPGRKIAELFDTELVFFTNFKTDLSRILHQLNTFPKLLVFSFEPTLNECLVIEEWLGVRNVPRKHNLSGFSVCR